MFVCLLFFGAIICFFFKILLPIYLIGLIAYLGLALIFAARKYDSFNEIVKIVFAFFILHFSYGLGYLEGIVNFVFLRNKPRNSSNNLSR